MSKQNKKIEKIETDGEKRGWLPITDDEIVKKLNEVIDFLNQKVGEE